VKEHLLSPTPVSATCITSGRLPFGFGRRFLLLLLLGLLWSLPAFWNPRFLLVMLAWDVMALIAWLVDLSRLPKAGQLVVERKWSAPASLRNETKIDLGLTNNSSSSLHCLLLDDVPVSLRSAPPEMNRGVPPRSAASTSYAVRPLQRGDLQIGSVYLRYQSPARFAERWAKADLSQQVRIYPDLEEAKRHNLYLTRARQIELERRLVRQRGTGREFESLRDYQQGDEFRDICWTATARRGKHVTKLYEVERSQAVWIVVDAGRLLRTRVGELSKLDLSVNAALTLAQLALYSGDKVGVLVYGRKSQSRVSLGRGLPHMRAILETLAIAHDESSEADHLRAASILLQSQKRRSLIVWITDLAETSMTPEVIESASQMLSRHVLLFIVIAQTDLQAMANRRPANATEMYETIAAQEMMNRREVLLARVHNRGALALEVSPQRLTPMLVNQYLEIKERNLI